MSESEFDTKQPLICYTAGGMLLHDNKVLLVKHKKLGIWLNPGGHIDEGEAPHQAAEREFWEETGVRVRAVDALQFGHGNDILPKSKVEDKSVFYPNPISTNLHWVNEESYQLRQKSANPKKRVPTKVWKRGCEQHLGFFYLLEATGSLDFKQNEEETDGIAWFEYDEIADLETRDSIKNEIIFGYRVSGITP